MPKRLMFRLCAIRVLVGARTVTLDGGGRMTPREARRLAAALVWASIRATWKRT